jgi:hypothetical protein
VLIAYLDEFGHVGPYIEHGHPRFGQHPIFGFAGFILPASEARSVGAEFKRVKTTLFKTEIDKSRVPAQWERKGAEYFTSGSIEKRPEQIRTFKHLLQTLRRAGGKLFYYGDEKLVGTLKVTGQEPTDVTRDALKETINRICTEAERRGEDVLILMDAITDKTRQELAAKMYAHIYSRKRTEMYRIVEAPLHIESKLNSNIQFADWICGLIGRASHFQMVEKSEFDWASTHFRDAVSGQFTHESKLHVLYGQEVHNNELFRPTSLRHAPMPAGTVGSQVRNIHDIYRAAVRQRGR